MGTDRWVVDDDKPIGVIDHSPFTIHLSATNYSIFSLFLSHSPFYEIPFTSPEFFEKQIFSVGHSICDMDAFLRPE